MYYKIENQQSELYQQLHSLRTKELQIGKDNIAAIAEKTGLEWTMFFGDSGQQNFGRTTSYRGFVFTWPEKVDPKIWKRHRENQDAFVPNARTKTGREMKEFLLNGLQSSDFGKVFKILGIDFHSNGTFSFPYLEIVGDVIVLYTGKLEPKSEDVIEITKKEFNQILATLHQ